ncbi:hypothetical protein GPJ56_002213 [Histomonas meleagridis]|uniref:uncharacterized protein n=1 Tax=Histomonas meleagridis TaxID=135588 RepID=UPI00355A6C87|nr:hypothetical protein GPJ56_002213 [Histomonas meleagridis]KAH0796142.1 hypothetical protein GO595_011109 [Histomonas meleagridis]
MALQILQVIHPYIHQRFLSKLFQEICEVSPSIPDYFLFELFELPPSIFDNIFTSAKSRLSIYSQCKPIFIRSVLTTINEFCCNPLNLDLFLNNIRTRVTQKKNEDGVKVRNFSTSKLNPQLSEFHHSICSEPIEKLLSIAGEQLHFYQEICSILRDIWEKTGNSLTASLRLELAFKSQQTQFKDPLLPFAKSIFNLFDSGKPNYLEQNFRALPDFRFITYDPLLRFYLYCEFIRRTFERIKKCRYEPYENRTEQNKFLFLLTPMMQDEEREDLSNNIEAIFIAFDLGEPRFSECLDALQKDTKVNDESSHLIMFVGQLYLELHDSPALIEIASNENVAPDVIVGYLMMRWLALMGLTDASAHSMLRLIICWARKDRFILSYLLALLECRLDKRMKQEQEIIGNIINEIGECCFEGIEKAMFEHICSVLNQ